MRDTQQPLAPAQADFTLGEEQRLIFMEVIEESLRLHHRAHFFNWLQRGFQYLLAHEVVILGVRGEDQTSYDYEYMTTSRYFADLQFDTVLNVHHGLVSHAFEKWDKLSVPVFYQSLQPTQENANFTICQVDDAILRQSELKNFVVHGFGDRRGRVSTRVMFGRLGSAVCAQTAHWLELLMPHLHCAIVKVTASRGAALMTTNAQSSRIQPLTKRELEVLEWLQAGKTNWEISNIIQVSPLTVKNHVQNILRKLEVENRAQAATKASKLGLLAKKTSSL